MEEYRLIVHNKPKSPTSESFRTFRTNVQFSNIDSSLKTIMFTSSEKGEGKSTVSSNYALSLIQNNSRVCIVDCDMRKPTQNKIFGLSNSYGLSNYVVEKIDKNEVIKKTKFDNLHLITSGPTPPNPSELLNSDKAKNLFEELKKEYDYIIIDTPPVNYVTDAAIVGTYVDAGIVVLNSGKTHKASLKHAVDHLNRVGTNILGVVMNRLKAKDSYYSRYYDRYYY